MRNRLAKLTLTLSMLALLAACGSLPPRVAATPDPLVGAWHAKVMFRDGAFAGVDDLELLYAFNAGGTMLESSNYDGAPPVPPAYGAWRRTESGRYEARYRFFTTKPPADLAEIARGGGWMPSGYGELLEQIELAADGRSFTSTLSLTLFDSAGKPADGGGSATGQGTRLDL